MATNLIFEHGVHYEAPVAAGTTEVLGAAIPVSEAQRVVFMTAMSAYGSNGITIQGSRDGGSTWFDLDITITLPATDGDPVVVELYRPKGVTDLRRKHTRAASSTVEATFTLVGDAIRRQDHGAGVSPQLFEGAEEVSS